MKDGVYLSPCGCDVVIFLNMGWAHSIEYYGKKVALKQIKKWTYLGKL